MRLRARCAAVVFMACLSLSTAICHNEIKITLAKIKASSHQARRCSGATSSSRSARAGNRFT
ncbi:hypothetical protein D3C86_1941970 [compost metagenome]